MDFDSDDAGCLKSDGTNYLLWSYMMRNFELEGELWDHVSGSVTRPHPKDKSYANLLKQWESMNATALSIIEMYVDHSLRKHLAKYNSAKSAWDYLARLYAHDDESNFAKKYRLEMEIQAVKQSGFPITGLYCFMQCYWQQLAEMEPKELSDLESYNKYREESRLLQLLLALPDEFEPARKHILQRSTLPSVSEAMRELLVVEHRLIKAQLSSLSFEDSDKSKTGRDECLYCYGTGCQKLDCPARKKNDQTKRTGGSNKDSHQSGGCQPSIKKPMQCPDKKSQPSSSSSKSASSLTPDDNQTALSIDQYQYMINITNQVESDLFGRSPLESGTYLPPSRKASMARPGGRDALLQRPLPSRDPFPTVKEAVPARSLLRRGFLNSQPPPVALGLRKEGDFNLTGDTGLVTALSTTLKILSYNVWLGDLERDKRMEALGDIIQLHAPDVICFQEVTPCIYDIFRQSSWWKAYNCSISDEMAVIWPYFCMQLSKFPVKSFSYSLFSNTIMLRELCMAEIEVGGKPLIVATSHLESPCPAPPKWDQMYSEERVAQAKEALNLLEKYPNVVFGGDMDWDDNLDGQFPLSDGWLDAWAELRPGENGWTYDTGSNLMLSANRPLQKRLDRFICNLHDFKLSAIDMIGMEPIPGLSYCKEKRVRNRVQRLMLPVLPSDHYGLLLKVNRQ